jgi:glycosyltransferase involved in cell wall biosynthesis
MTGPSPAAIVLFTYNRPRHTRQTIEALLKNEPASDSELFVFSDGPKDASDAENVQAVRNYIRTVRGFKKITIIERENNRGLADNIIDGVTRIVNSHGRVIVLEDDIITSPDFLRYMNEALDFYQDETRVWHISGWNYPIDTFGLPDAFLWRVMNCWGWATWQDRWRHFERDPNGLIRRFTKEQIKRFNLDDSHDFWAQVRANAEGRITTWAIFWYAVIFMNNGLCLNPTRSLVRNIGHDGSGVHCGDVEDNISDDRFKGRSVHELPGEMQENAEVVARVKKILAGKKGGAFITRLICKSIMGD